MEPRSSFALAMWVLFRSQGHVLRQGVLCPLTWPVRGLLRLLRQVAWIRSEGGKLSFLYELQSNLSLVVCACVLEAFSRIRLG